MTTDTLPLRRIDHVKFFVGNARQSAYIYRNAFGFDVIAYAGLEMRQKHEPQDIGVRSCNPREIK